MKNPLEQYQPVADKIQQKLLEGVSPDLPDGLREPILYFLETPGKKIRPLLAIFSCQAVGGGMEDALPAAVAVEYFHDFTLIHDDIMDRDELRRGKPTIHTRWDDGTAILTGDAFIGMAYQELLKAREEHLIPLVRLFSETVVRVCEGQALDKDFEHRPRVRLEEYLEMISKKTAWLIKASCQMGAILGGGTAEQIEALGEFGHFLGLAFQIQDDLLDFVADEATLGKRLGSDYRMDKKTYVVLKYQEKLLSQPELQQHFPLLPHHFSSFEKFRQALQSLQIVEIVQQDVERYFQQSLAALQRVQPLTEENPLFVITRFVQHRTF